MDWQTLSAIAGVLVVICGALAWLWRKAIPAARKWARFADRIMGVPADPHTGQPEVLGIFERLDHQDGVLETIRHEVEFNNGSSVKDAITRIEKRLDDPAPGGPTTTINVNPGGAHE